MRKFVTLCFILTLFFGCSYGIEEVIKDPGGLLRDPHFAQYEEKLNDLEREYLQKKITYVEYLEEKKELEEDYEREVQHRERGSDGFR